MLADTAAISVALTDAAEAADAAADATGVVRAVLAMMAAVSDAAAEADVTPIDAAAGTAVRGVGAVRVGAPLDITTEATRGTEDKPSTGGAA